MKGVVFAVLGLSISCVVACGGSAGATFPDEKPPESGFGSGSQGGLETPTPDPSGDACSVAARLVYVVSQEKDLYSFTPNTTTFSKIGRLNCPAAGVPASMAIDRSGTAWVNYADGSLFKVSTTDASCTATGFVPNQQGFLKFGMAFATNGTSGTEETLYISGLLGTEGKGFGKIDLSTMKVMMLGEYANQLAGEAAELTGTGDGRLYGFFTTKPFATLAQVDRLKGLTSSDKALDGVSTGNAFAFTFWGGDLWFYTSERVSDRVSLPSQVTQLKMSTGELVIAKKAVGGFRIVGAGVSTCAPIPPPR